MIYQVHYNEYTRSRINPISVPLDNSVSDILSPFFENRAIIKVAEKKHEMIGVLSWQFESKMGYSIQRISDAIEVDTSTDIFTFFGKHTTPMWKAAENWHPGITQLAQNIMDEAFISVDLRAVSNRYKIGTTNIIYNNAFVCRGHILEQYVNEMLLPAVKVMIENYEISQRCNADSGYRRGSKDLQRLVDVTGFPYYTMHTFICERLFSTWLSMNNNPFKIRHLK